MEINVGTEHGWRMSSISPHARIQSHPHLVGRHGDDENDNEYGKRPGKKTTAQLTTPSLSLSQKKRQR